MKRVHALRQAFRRQRRALSGALPKAIEGAVEPLHRARVASRRLREMLAIGQELLPAKLARKSQREARRVTRALGGVRELDVALQLVSSLERGRGRDAAACAQLRLQLEANRRTRRGKLLASFDAASVAKLERVVDQVDRVLGGVSSTDAWDRQLATRLAQHADRVVETVERAGALYASDHVHDVRIAVKKLRYALELTHESEAARVRTAIGRLKAVQEILGSLHDREVLLRDAHAARAAASPDEPWVAELVSLIQALERECRRLHARYVARRPALLELCAGVDGVAERIWTSVARPARHRAVEGQARRRRASRGPGTRRAERRPTRRESRSSI